MAVFFWYLVKVICLVYATVHEYTGQVTFSKEPEKTVMFKWSPCIFFRLKEDGTVQSNVAVGTPDYISPEILRVSTSF